MRGQSHLARRSHKVSVDGTSDRYCIYAGCPSMLKNKEGKTPRLLAKDNEHKDALKECRKAEKQSAKLAKGGSRTGEPYAIRVSDHVV